MRIFRFLKLVRICSSSNSPLNLNWIVFSIGACGAFNNQLLMLCRWKKGMSACSVCLEHASLWVQIWSAPFDMLSLKMATDVGT